MSGKGKERDRGFFSGASSSSASSFSRTSRASRTAGGSSSSSGSIQAWPKVRLGIFVRTI